MGGAFLKGLTVAGVYLSPYRIPVPTRERGLGEDDWQMENHSLGKLSVEVWVLQSYTGCPFYQRGSHAVYVLALPKVLWVVCVDISAGVEAYRAGWLPGLALKPACGLTRKKPTFSHCPLDLTSKCC